MKDKAHHIRHVQRKVIQDTRRELRKKQSASPEKEPIAELTEEAVKETSALARGVDRSTVYRNRSHQGYH